jgi:hypothetical protein
MLTPAESTQPQLGGLTEATQYSFAGPLIFQIFRPCAELRGLDSFLNSQEQRHTPTSSNSLVTGALSLLITYLGNVLPPANLC